MTGEPQAEHAWLQKLVGEWTVETECRTGPGEPATTMTGTETVRSIGGLWVVCEGRGGMPGGGTAEMVLTLGYDPARRRYVGTFVASMMTHLWLYDGTLDPAGRALTLDTTGPSYPAGDRTAPYQDVIAFDGDDRRTLTSHVRGDDGAWVPFMTARYQRVGR